MLKRLPVVAGNLEVQPTTTRRPNYNTYDIITPIQMLWLHTPSHWPSYVQLRQQS